jgi:transposase InsO family protein
MMTKLLKIDRSGYYAWVNSKKASLTNGSRAKRRNHLRTLILQHWKASGKTYGIRRIQADLLEFDGQKVSYWLVAKLMAELGIAGIQPRSIKRTTIPDPDAPTRPDLVQRNFNPPVATSTLVSDITYLRTAQGWLYLATVIDLTTRMVVGWQIADHMRTSLVLDALKMAYKSGFVAGNAIVHSDRGSQYLSKAYSNYAKAINIRLSVGRTGSCLDNAVAESFFGFMKNEMYHHYRFATKAEARLAVAEYIEVFYNRRRRHSTLNYQTPYQAMLQHLNPVTIQNLRLAA